jgi:hypothetical protein
MEAEAVQAAAQAATGSTQSGARVDGMASPAGKLKNSG